jgi:hypothetical protein
VSPPPSERRVRRGFVLPALWCLCALVENPAAANPSPGAASRHHVSVTAGAARYADDVRPEFLMLDAVGSEIVRGEFDVGRELGIRYRHAVRPGSEIVATFHRTEISAADRVLAPNGTYKLHLAHRTDAWAVGGRASDVDGRIRPFLEATFVLAREWSGVRGALDSEGANLGFGAAAGVEIGIAPALSFPIELGFRFATPLGRSRRWPCARGSPGIQER